jgi:ribosomal protein L21E
MEPTLEQIKAAMEESSDGDLKARHLTRSGLIINEYRYGDLVAIDAEGNIIHDTPIA